MVNFPTIYTVDAFAYCQSFNAAKLAEFGTHLEKLIDEVFITPHMNFSKARRQRCNFISNFNKSILAIYKHVLAQDEREMVSYVIP